MAFLSSMLSKLTDPGGNSRQDNVRDDPNLTCKDEVDDFLLVTEKKDNFNNTSNLQNQPPTYYEITGADNSTSSSGWPVPDYLPDYTDELSKTDGSEEVKISPLDGVPFSLWYGYGCASQTAQLVHQLDSILSGALNAADITKKYAYTFESEISVLREYGDDCEQKVDMTEMNIREQSSGASYSDVYGDFGIQPIENHAIDANRNNVAAGPEIGCLIDFT